MLPLTCAIIRWLGLPIFNRDSYQIAKSAFYFSVALFKFYDTMLFEISKYYEGVAKRECVENWQQPFI